MRHYAAEHRLDWDLFVQPLMYAYDIQVYCTKGMNPFSMVLSRQPPVPTTFVPLTALQSDANAETLPKELRLRLLSKIAEMRHIPENRTKATQQQFKQQHGTKVREETRFGVGQLVCMDHSPL